MTPRMVGVPVCILGSARAKPFFISYGVTSFRASSKQFYRSFLRDNTSLCIFYYFSCSVLQHNLGGLPTIMYSFLLEPHKELPPAGSWVDYLDPDYVLKVPYAHTAQEKS